MLTFLVLAYLDIIVGISQVWILMGKSHLQLASLEVSSLCTFFTLLFPANNAIGRYYFALIMYLDFLWFFMILIALFIESSDLRGNRLSGQIPDEIGDCYSLKNLWVIIIDRTMVCLQHIKSSQFFLLLWSFLFCLFWLICILIHNRCNLDKSELKCIFLRDLSFNELYGDIPFSISKLKLLEFL